MQIALDAMGGDHAPGPIVAGAVHAVAADPELRVVLVGDSDELTPPALSRELAEGIAGSRLVIVADCGHLSTMEQPDAVNRALVDWMTG